MFLDTKNKNKYINSRLKHPQLPTVYNLYFHRGQQHRMVSAANKLYRNATLCNPLGIIPTAT